MREMRRRDERRQRPEAYFLQDESVHPLFRPADAGVDPVNAVQAGRQIFSYTYVCQEAVFRLL